MLDVPYVITHAVPTRPDAPKSCPHCNGGEWNVSTVHEIKVRKFDESKDPADRGFAPTGWTDSLASVKCAVFSCFNCGMEW